MTEEDLYKRYFVSDAYIELSGGEGLCLPIIEALSHNKPVIYLDYGGHVEYCKDLGYAVHVKDYFCARNINMKWALPSIPDTVNKMCLVSQLKEKINTSEFIKNTFDWNSVIIPKILNTIKEKFIQKEKLSFNMKRVI
jgi:glycosyltransferase involved in cell wall biosynthesis